MLKWIKKKIKDYQNKRRIKKLSLDRDYDLTDRCILSFDFGNQTKREDNILNFYYNLNWQNENLKKMIFIQKGEKV